MSDDTRNIEAWINELMKQSTADQITVLQRYGELVQRVARGEIDEQAVRDLYMEYAREATLSYSRSVATLSLSYYGALNQLNRSYHERFFEQVLDNTRAPAPPESAAEAPPRAEIEMRAPIGGAATAEFALENRRLEPVEISFMVSEFTLAGGTYCFRPPLQITPPRFTLSPREERKVTLSLPLLDGLFEAGQRYTATIAVRNYDNLQVGLTVCADPVPVEVEAEAPRVAPQFDPDPALPQVKTYRRRTRASEGSANGRK